MSGLQDDPSGWLKPPPGLGSWWAATVATYCPGRMGKHPKSQSPGDFNHPDGSPCKSTFHLDGRMCEFKSEREERVRDWKKARCLLGRARGIFFSSLATKESLKKEDKGSCKMARIITQKLISLFG